MSALISLFFSSRCQENRPSFLHFLRNFFVEVAFSLEPYGRALLQAVQLNRKTKVRYLETSLRLRRPVLKVSTALNRTYLLIWVFFVFFSKSVLNLTNQLPVSVCAGIIIRIKCEILMNKCFFGFFIFSYR